MDTNQLAAALRNKASQLRGLNTENSADDDVLRDAATLLRVLAHVVDGKALSRAFGAPGDWGYDTQIGQALASASEVPNAEITGSALLRSPG